MNGLRPGGHFQMGLEHGRMGLHLYGLHSWSTAAVDTRMWSLQRRFPSSLRLSVPLSFLAARAVSVLFFPPPVQRCFVLFPK